MVRLLPLTPCAELLPITVGDMVLTEVKIDALRSVAPFAGKKTQVSEALKEQIGLGLPAVNRMQDKGNARVQWFGHGTWLLRGDVALDGLASVTDQSDAWAVVALEGPQVSDVLARLVPVDVRSIVFKNGYSLRTMLGHMSVSITRTSAQTVEIMAMRSMAGTLVHELESAMRGVTARG